MSIVGMRKADVKEPKTTVKPDLRVAICGNADVGQSSAKRELMLLDGVFASPSDLRPTAIEEFPASSEAIEQILDPARDLPFDLLIVDDSTPGFSGISLIRELRARERGIGVIMMTPDDGLAYDALMVGVDAFLPHPVISEVFRETATRILADIAARRPETVVLRFRDRVRRLDRRDIVYAETVGHDQVLHMRSSDKMPVRSSSQALFDKLSDDTRFFKAGSSFIVNLSFVRSVGRDGAARLSGGSTVTVPVRLRRAFADALLACSAG